MPKLIAFKYDKCPKLGSIIFAQMQQTLHVMDIDAPIDRLDTDMIPNIQTLLLHQNCNMDKLNLQNLLSLKRVSVSSNRVHQFNIRNYPKLQDLDAPHIHPAQLQCGFSALTRQMDF